MIASTVFKTSFATENAGKIDGIFIPNGNYSAVIKIYTSHDTHTKKLKTKKCDPAYA